MGSGGSVMVPPFPEALDPWTGLDFVHMSQKGAFVRMGLWVMTPPQNFTLKMILDLVYSIWPTWPRGKWYRVFQAQGMCRCLGNQNHLKTQSRVCNLLPGSSPSSQRWDEPEPQAGPPTQVGDGTVWGSLEAQQTGASNLPAPVVASLVH